ncbi:transporter substrate-binding domain-containing protein [Massilia solisilvae]|uniref:Transporter substrate-binding domain-containing protein n=1 Tax=Massilia solisilvae TaxID=1811225 RepID=A0ABT2BLI3_9BURK|nr:transporter substrate-binding domain-containing protein [Massilia solisilvae]MCS0609384.1 transporter substrate-binding domain-containing protein [Massilia solisilvae]
MSTKSTAIALLLALCATATAQGQPKLYLTTETSAPSSMIEGGRVTGIGTDKVREIMARAGIDYTIDLLPWKRAYMAALERPDACVFSTTRTAEREALFKWVGPTDEAQWVLAARIGSGIRLNTLEDARKYRIGTYNGDARDQYLRERGFQVDPAPNDLINPRKLIMGRIDLWAAAWRHGSLVLGQHGWDKQIAPVLTFNRLRVYLACNRGVPDELVARMNAAVEAMTRDGTMRRIERKYDAWVPPGSPE